MLRFKYSNTLKKHQVTEGNLVILGNGPSLKASLEEAPSFFDHASMMAVNLFVLSDQFETLKPQHYVLLDIGFFKADTLPRVKAITEKLIENFIEKTTWPLKLFLPQEGKGSKLHKMLEESAREISFVFFNRTNISGLKSFRHWAYGRNLGMPAPQNVLVACVDLAICLNYREVYLLGADHSWLENIRINEDNALISVEKHFYDKDKKGVPTKREHPDTLQSSKLHDYLHDLSRTFASYHILNEFAKTRGVKIWNATRESYIDAFDRLK